MVLPFSSQALDATATGQCLGGAHVVSVSGFYIEENMGEIVDGEISGLVFECQAIGVCVPSYFYPETPLPFDPQPGGESGYPEYSAEISINPPLTGVAYRYRPYGVRPDGTLVPTEAHCGGDGRSYALVGCPDSPIARGVFVFWGRTESGDLNFMFEGCSTSCWTEDIWFTMDTPTIEELTGQPIVNVFGHVIDVFGNRTYCSMPSTTPGGFHVVTGISLTTDDDCGPVPEFKTNWGSLKARFR